jgi:glyoxylase-like metal-dependent hydrolase (beta-lactamase superfamily II)/rhodanese-related sulfurtransferase
MGLDQGRVVAMGVKPKTQRAVCTIETVVDEGLGHQSSLVGFGDGSALVVDPARFPERQRRLAAARGWRIAWTADTHSHADYISGSPELAADGATFLASRGARLEMAHRPVDPGDSIELAAGVELRAIATPGHTPDHLAYLLLCDGVPEALFSGGSLMVGALGRTDLLGDERREALARDLFRALRGEILTLPDDLSVYPTHGAGSFCSAPAGSARTTTIGQERTNNPLLRIDDEDAFVDALVADLGSFPRYFRQLPEINRRGVRIFPSVPRLARLDLDTMRGHLAHGAVLVDARPISAYAQAHPRGAISIEHRPVFASWLGWLVALDAPVVFVLDDDTDRPDIVRQCLTIGHEAILGELDGGFAAWGDGDLPIGSTPLVGPAAVEATVLDVRQDSEWAAGHVPGAIHVELGSLPGATLPDTAMTVICGHGERAMTGASLLEAAGHRDVSVLAGGPTDWSDATGIRLQTA